MAVGRRGGGGSSAETTGAFNTGVQIVNLQRPTMVVKSKFWGLMKDRMAWMRPEDRMATTLPASMG